MNVVTEPHKHELSTTFNDHLLKETNTRNDSPRTNLSMGPTNESNYSRPIPRTHHSSRTVKICARCNLLINQGSLKALGNYYHEDCFVCFDCGKVCKPKYFPFEDSATKQLIPLCQQDYFKRNNLLCYVCDKPLRGVYYNAFGKLYDEEHFCCKICQEKCGVNTCFNYEDDLYCKYHFLKYFSNRCKGCDYPISDQYIEFPRGDDIHRWHPECYGIHKYWHVSMPPESVGLPSIGRVDLKDLENQLREESHPTRPELEKYVQSFGNLVSKTWSVLYRFEEETAVCISDMFQYLTSLDQLKGLNSTALFVLKIECLFKALDSLDSLNFYNCSYATPKTTAEEKKLSEDEVSQSRQPENMNLKYTKFPRNLSTKVMIYLQLLRKLSTATRDKDVNISSLMSVITGLAHFLKLLVRYGLYNALEHNKSTHAANALIKFLREIEKNEVIEGNSFSHIDVSINATDCCAGCGKYVQEECIQFKENRWHRSCFSCSICEKHIDLYDVADAAYNTKTRQVLCAHCALDDPDSSSGFKSVSKLAQLIFLLKIALVRSRAVMEIQLKNREVIRRSNSVKEAISMQQTYIRTLNDIKRLKSRRQSVPVTSNKQEARKSRILETAEMDISNEMQPNDKCLVIQTDRSSVVAQENQNMFNSTKTLTLDDISRIVAAEQARELRPNAFAYFKKLKENDEEGANLGSKKSGVYFSELNLEDHRIIKLISIALLSCGKYALLKDESAVEKFIPSPPKEEKQSNGSFWFKMKTMMTKESKKNTRSKVFGTPLEVLSLQWGVDSDLGIGPSKIKIPILVDELVSSLRQMDMSVEGVFRKNGNIRKLRELAIAIDNNPSEVPNLSNENAVQLSALLKKFLRELPDPLLTFPLYHLWIQVAKIESDFERRKLFGLLYAMLPCSNRNVAEVLFSFLHWTSSFSHIDSQMGSRMDIHNLSTVMTPNILYQEVNSTHTPPESSGVIHDTYNDAFAQNEGENYFLAIEVVDYLVNHNEDLSIVPKFMILLLQEIRQKGLSEFSSIQKFVRTKVQEGNINFSEYEVIESVQMKKSASVAKVEITTRDNLP